MGTLYLVRHGQASFGAANYDQLSALGERQCRALGEWFAARGVGFGATFHGTLARHAQSFEALAAGHGALPAAQVESGLDEYDAHALVHAVHPAPLPPHDTPEGFRTHFRALREGLARWMAGELTPAGMKPYAQWMADLQAVLEQVRPRHEGAVLAVSSGGPICNAVARLLGAPPAAAVELNMQIRNSSVTEFHFTPQRHALVVFNHVPHLDHPDRQDWITRT